MHGRRGAFIHQRRGGAATGFDQEGDADVGPGAELRVDRTIRFSPEPSPQWGAATENLALLARPAGVVGQQNRVLLTASLLCQGMTVLLQTRPGKPPIFAVVPARELSVCWNRKRASPRVLGAAWPIGSCDLDARACSGELRIAARHIEPLSLLPGSSEFH